jgi:hypothetical protein
MNRMMILLTASFGSDGSLRLVHYLPGDRDVFAFPARDLTADEALRVVRSLPLWVLGRAGLQAASDLRGSLPLPSGEVAP